MAPIPASELAQWFDTHAAALVLYARQWVDAAAAEDIVQEVFLRLAAVERRPENVRAWLLKCVRNAAIDALRRGRREARRDRQAHQQCLLEARDAAAELDAGDVQIALAALPADVREVVTLKIWSGATFEEIAGVTGMPLSTVYHRYKEGLAAMRARWELLCPKK